MNNWYANSIQQEAGMKENAIMAILGGLLAWMPFEAACKETAKQSGLSEQSVRQIANQNQSAQQQAPTQQASGLNLARLKAQLIQDEGNRPHVYKDSKGIKTIGIGCNLERKDMPQRMATLGIDYRAVVSGRLDLTPQQIQALFDEDVNKAIVSSRSLISNFNQLPAQAQEIVVNMMFNMGNKLAGFHHFIVALQRRDFKNAAKEMENSDWYRQVGGRSKRLVSIMQGLA